MLETEDPRSALGAKDLPTQAAAARDLAKMGDWSDIPALLELATTHRRTGLRLGAAAAAADILHRYRTGSAGETLGEDRIQYVLEWARRIDPGVNPSALMLLSAMPGSMVISRLGRLLRDPRSDVRLATTVALRRMVLSHCDVESTAVQKAMVEWLAHRKLTADTRAELIKLIGEVGWTTLRTAVFDASAYGSACTEASEQALKRLEARDKPESWHGVWQDLGWDVLEQGISDSAPGWLLIGSESLCQHDGKAKPWKLQQSRIVSALIGPPARLVWAPQLGKPEPLPTIQIQNRTWFHVPVDDLVDWLDQHIDEFTPAHAGAVDGIATVLHDAEGIGPVRVTGMAYIATGRAQEGLEHLSGLLSAKKHRHDLHYWAGRAHETLGDRDQAIACFTRFLEKKSKNKSWTAHAEVSCAKG